MANSGSYVISSSFGEFTASINLFSQSISSFTASFTASVQSIGDARYVGLIIYNSFSASHNSFSASINTLMQSLNGFTASFSSSVQYIGDRRFVSTINEFTGALTILAGPNITISSGSGFIMITGSAGSSDLTALNLFSASINIFTQSINGFTSSFSASVQSIGDVRYTSLTSFNTFSSSVNTFTASQITTNTTQTTLNTALNLFSASINILTQSLNGFTSSFSASVQSIGDARYIREVTGSDNFFITNLLKVSGTLLNPVGHLIFSSSNGSTVTVSGNLKITNEISDYLGAIVSYSGPTYSFSASDSGKIIELSSSAGAPINCYLPNNLKKGWNGTIVQMASASLVHFSISLGSTLSCFNQLSKSAGWYSEMSIYVSSNVSGVSASYVLGGNLI